VHPDAVAPGCHETAFPQIRKMAGDGRLREPEAVVDMADAHLVVAQQRKDANAGVIRQCLEQVLQLVDSGPGVRAEDESKLFSPFFTTKPPGEGTGLGLSVSYGIIQSYGGKIGYRRGDHGGAVFYFDLPAADN
jgi:C4-dicarboxylate-specific signal transduction histidine kinase